MNRTNSVTFAAAIGAAGLLAFAAIAQTGPDTPAPEAPATEQAAPSASPDDQATPPASPGERWGRDRRDDRMWGARTGREGRGMGGPGRSWSDLSEGDRKAMMEARIAAVRAGLQLTEDQSKLWDPAETAMREFMQQRLQWREQMRGQERPESLIERMERRADMMSERGASLKKMAQAVRPLYDSLDEDQKRRLGLLTRHFHVGMAAAPGSQRGHHMQRHGRDHGMGRGGSGYRQHGYSHGDRRGHMSERGSYRDRDYRGRGYEGYHGRGYHHGGRGYGRWQ